MHLLTVINNEIDQHYLLRYFIVESQKNRVTL